MMTHPQTVATDPRSAWPPAGQPSARDGTDGTITPQRPSRAHNVRLIGQMQGSGFVEQPWLIERDNRFIQVPELLFRVAEAADGRRTLDEIADHLTQTTEWIISPELVHQIIETKLGPIGIVVMDGNLDGAADMKPSSSPLSFRIRTKLIGPGVIEPISSVLQVFFAPPILIPVLIAVAVAHWWLYFVHGIGGSIRAAMYTPGFLPLSLLVLIAANVFHEFGHAAALRYGGGKVRGMGAGVFLIWPMLYTDVTDSYRLSRRDRLRTDLGGVYFHLIAALGIVGLYLMTGHEYLLTTVLLISFQVIGQFVPFARFDGYWVMADLTGIPDFFSQIKPFLRSITPGRRWRGSQLPPLRRWVKVVFTTYIVITIPVVALLLVLMIKSMPKLVRDTWDALLYQQVEFTIARMDGNVPMTIAIVVQALFLLLQLVGLSLILYNVVRVPVTLTRDAVRARRWRLASAALGATAAVLLALAFVWMTQLGASGGAPPAGVERFSAPERTDVDEPIQVDQSPPGAAS